MKKHRKLFPLILALVVLMTAIVSCGDHGDDISDSNVTDDLNIETDGNPPAETTDVPETEKYRYSSSIVSSGENNIQPIQCMRGTTQYKNGEPVLEGCGDGVYRIFNDPETKLSDIPVLAWNGEVKVSVPVNVQLGYIKVYSTDYEELEYSIKSFSDLSALPYGEYLVVFAEQIDGRGCDAEIEDFRITDNECLFRLVIPEPSSMDFVKNRIPGCCQVDAV
ncbi:MAG: hypothetical protein IJ325_07805 [Clostridia bacterium]|nr:hypothetical protein [Clostridia bacterium]